MHHKKGKRLRTSYGRDYTILGGPWHHHHGKGYLVYAVRDEDTGNIELKNADLLDGLTEVE